MDGETLMKTGWAGANHRASCLHSSPVEATLLYWRKTEEDRLHLQAVGTSWSVLPSARSSFQAQ